MSNEADQEKLLARWLSDTLSEEEKELLKKESGLEDLRFTLDDLEGWKVPAMDKEAGLKDLKYRIDIAREPREKKQVFFQPWLRIAASMILIAAVAYLFKIMLSSGPTSVTTGFGETLSYVLPDGSKVELDANSSITYSEKKWKEERTLNLVGRALFTVQKGSAFKVNTEAGNVTVLGTVFDVLQRKSNELTVKCYEGLVQVDYGNSSEKLKAGEGLVAINNLGSPIEVTGSGPAWVNKTASFTDTPLKVVVEELEAFYGLEISLPTDSQSEPFTGELNYGDLENALIMLANVFEMSYTRSGNSVTFQ